MGLPLNLNQVRLSILNNTLHYLHLKVREVYFSQIANIQLIWSAAALTLNIQKLKFSKVLQAVKNRLIQMLV